MNLETRLGCSFVEFSLLCGPVVGLELKYTVSSHYSCELFGRLTRLTVSEGEGAKRELGELLSHVARLRSWRWGRESFVSSWQVGGKRRKVAHVDKLARLLLAIGSFPMLKQ